MKKWIKKILSDSSKQTAYICFAIIILGILVHGISLFLYAKLDNPSFIEISGIYYIFVAFCFDIIYLFYIPENFCFLQFVKLILYVPISRFTDIYIYEYYHLLFQYCIGIFWHQEVVLRRNQKEICDYSKLFEYRKYTEEEKKNLIISFVPYFVTVITFLFFPLLTKKVVESVIFLIPVFCISFRSLFFLSLYNSSKNGIPCNEIDFKSLEAMENPVPVSSLMLPVLVAIFLSETNWISFVIASWGAAIVFIQDLWHLGNMRINVFKPYKKIILLYSLLISIFIT